MAQPRASKRQGQTQRRPQRVLCLVREADERERRQPEMPRPEREGMSVKGRVKGQVEQVRRERLGVPEPVSSPFTEALS